MQKFLDNFSIKAGIIGGAVGAGVMILIFNASFVGLVAGIAVSALVAGVGWKQVAG